MRIARIIEYFPPHIGGMERHGLILSQEQVKLGHEVDVFISYGNNRSGSTQIEADQRGNYLRESAINPHKSASMSIYKMPFQFLPLYSKARRLWFNFWAYNKVKKIHEKNPFDIVHLHGDFVEARFGGRLADKLKIPAILTIHAGLNKKLLLLKNKKYFDGLKKIICVSEEIAKSLDKIGVWRDRMSVISSGIYLDEFKKENGEIFDLRNRYSKPIIISVGVFRVNKGFGHLINAFKEVLKKFDSATLLIIGDGPKKNDLIKQEEGISQIKFLGNQNHGEVVKHLKAADIFVLASVSTQGDREGTSTSIMEAMAAGLPVVTTKVGGNPYLIKDVENGFLVEEKDSAVLAQAIIKLISDENLRQKMRDKNLEDIKQKDWPIITKQITDAYFSQ